MPKKIFDALFVIDANEKPVPSFLTAYIFTWLIFNKENTFKFIETTGDFFVRLNAAIAVPVTNGIWEVLGWTFLLVGARFILNNAIYFFRESSDHLTQFALNKLNMKSFIKSTVHQKTLDDLAKSKSDSHAFYDRAKVAEQSETDAINKLGEFEESAQTEHYELQQSIDKYKKTLDEEATNNNTLKLKNKELNGQLDISKEELRQSSSAHEELIEKHATLMEDHNELNSNFKILETKHGKLTLQLTSIDTESQAKQTIIDKYIDEVKTTNQITTKWKSKYFSVKNKVDIWSKNTNVNELTLLYKNDKEFTKSDEEVFRRLIKTKIHFPESALDRTPQGLIDTTKIPFFQRPITNKNPLLQTYEGIGDSTNKPTSLTAAGGSSGLVNNQPKNVHSPAETVVRQTLADIERNINKTKNKK